MVLLLGWLVIPCSGQEGYLVTLQGDTLRGSIKIYSLDKTLEFVQIKSGKKKTAYSALQVRHLYLDGEHYSTQRNSEGYKFMKPIVSGYLSLYAFRPQGQMNYVGRQLVKLDGTSLEVPNLMFKSGVANFLSDCGQLSERIKEGELGKSDLDQIIGLYNDCLSKSTTEPEIAEVPSEKMKRLAALKEKVESIDSFGSRSDALDIIKDISQKLRENKPIPNYQLDALKEMLGSEESLRTALEEFLASLQ